MRRHAGLAVALVLQLLGAAGALVISTRTWQTIITPRPAPLPHDVLAVSGRTVDSAATALALVALAGAVAVLATRGLPRRIVGAVVAAAGVVLIWRSIAASAGISVRRARALVAERHPTVDAAAVIPRVVVHAGWPWQSAACGLIVALAGAVIAWHGHQWQVMSSRYERRPAGASEQAKATRLWSELDRGEDPTR